MSKSTEYCPFCGRSGIRPVDRFCRKCGKNIENIGKRAKKISVCQRQLRICAKCGHLYSKGFCQHCN